MPQRRPKPIALFSVDEWIKVLLQRAIRLKTLESVLDGIPDEAKQTVLQGDWELKGKTGMVFEFEVGRNVVGTWGVFVRPGVGIFGQGVGTT